jgi:hypothetical protein
MVEVVRGHETGDLEPGIAQRRAELADRVLVEVSGVGRSAANRLVRVAAQEHPEPLGQCRRVGRLDHEAARRRQATGKEPKHRHERDVEVLDHLSANDDVMRFQLGIVRVVQVDLGVGLAFAAREAMVFPPQRVDPGSRERLAQQGALEARADDEDPLRGEAGDEVEQQLVASGMRAEVDLLLRRVAALRQRRLRAREGRLASIAL